MRKDEKVLKNVLRGAAVALLIFVIFAQLALVPQEASAQPIEDFDTSYETFDASSDPARAVLQKELEKTTKPGSASGDQEKGAGCGWLSNPISCGIYKILDTFTDLIVTTFVSLASLVFDLFVKLAFQSLNDTSFVRVGYGITLGVANMFFVLILLWIAIATIFDFQPFSARQLLPKLIIAALLINFSLAIGSSFIKLANGIAKVFYDQLTTVTADERDREGIIPGTAIARRVLLVSKFAALKDTTPVGQANTADLDAIIAKGKCKEETDPFSSVTFADCNTAEAQAAWEQRFRKPRDLPGTLTGAFQSIFWKLVMTPVLIFVLLAGSLFLLIRQLSLAFVLVLGPLAFLFMILPATQRFYNQWWEKLIQWSFFFPAFMFFLFLSLQIGGNLLPNSIANSDQRLPLIFQYLMTIGLLIGSMIVANQMGIHSANTVTGWGKQLSGAAGKWTRERGWKYAGRATEGLMKVPGVGKAIGRITPLRAGATAVMKKGAGVEKKDVEFYTKLGDRQLALTLSGMRASQAEAIWKSLPDKRKREAKPELANLARERGWRGMPAAAAASNQQAIQNQVMPIVRDAVKNLPQDIQNAVAEATRQAIQNLPADATPQATHLAIQQAVNNVVQNQPAGVQLQVQAAIQGRNIQAQIQTAVEQARRETTGRPQARREDLLQRLEDLEEQVEGKADRT